MNELWRCCLLSGNFGFPWPDDHLILLSPDGVIPVNARLYYNLGLSTATVLQQDDDGIESSNRTNLSKAQVLTYT